MRRNKVASKQKGAGWTIKWSVYIVETYKLMLYKHPCRMSESLGSIFLLKSLFNLLRRTIFEHQEGKLVKVEIHPCVCIVCDIAPKMKSRNTMPRTTILFIAHPLDMCRYIFVQLMVIESCAKTKKKGGTHPTPTLLG